MELIIIVLATLLLSTAMFIFWIAKGGFNKNTYIRITFC